MKVVLYESSSRGGTYQYALSLLEAYKADSRITSVSLILPSNSKETGPEIKKILLTDRLIKNRTISRAYFLLRTFINPFIFFFHLTRQSKSLVIFNDFEQLSAPLWTLFFRFLLDRHRYAVFLHDPDRDNYPPSVGYSRYAMRCLLRMMDLALYHEWLPEKPYYKNRNTRYLSVPHGIYDLPSANELVCQQIELFKENNYLFAIIGNVRKEKNYEAAIRSIKKIKDARLIIAGSAQGTEMEKSLMGLAQELGISDRILWMVRYLEKDELASVIQQSDCILLNYSSTFSSQSGIVNMIAPFKKNMIVSETESGLGKVVRQYDLGIMVSPDSETKLLEGMKRIMERGHPVKNWDKFLAFASWKNQVELVIGSYGE